MRRGALIILAAALVSGAAVAQASLPVQGRWAVSQERCATESIEFGTDGKFVSTLDADGVRQGSYKTGADRIVLLDEAEPDRELALIILDLTTTRLVAFDETIEADRRLVKCR
jgi:hypothetical protein